jgi:cell fate (sporulation/competence/biofilm development) regulator YlbF (YheA/YmcA/DUF963 family)
MSEEKKKGNEQIKGIEHKKKALYRVLNYEDGKFTEEERRYLEKQLKSLFAFVGCVIPDKVEIDGVNVPVHELVWRMINKQNITEDEIAYARQLADMLEAKKNYDEFRLKHDELTDEQAENLYFEACGLMRAIVTLRELGDERTRQAVADRMRERKIEDAKQLIEFIKNIR